MHILIINARFYEDIADELIAGAETIVKQEGASYDIISVPGVFEIAGAMSMAIRCKKYDGYIALGCVIRGETTHYDYVCQENARALQQLAIEQQAAIGYGVLTVNNKEQAWTRARVDEGNKGAAAAKACLRMIKIQEQFSDT